MFQSIKVIGGGAKVTSNFCKLAKCMIFILTTPFSWSGNSKNKTNHPIASNSHPSATENNTLPQMGEGYEVNIINGNIILTKYEAVHPTFVSENYYSSWMLTALIKVQTVSILSNFLLANSDIVYLKDKNPVLPKLIIFQNIVQKFHGSRILALFAVAEGSCCSISDDLSCS